MKLIGCLVAAFGFLLILGTAGSMDSYDQCKMAADCVAAAPMSTLEVFLYVVSGLFAMIIGVSVVFNAE